MSEVMITVVGNVATEPRMDETKKGERFASFRLACNSQRYDSRTRTWVDDDASYYTVYCWRAPLADNIKTSLHKGDPVLVYGRLKNREWRDDNNAMRVSPEITARSLGHDLYRGISLFTKVSRQPILPEDDDAVDSVRAAYLAQEQGVDRRTGEILAGQRRAGIQPAPGWPPDGARPMDGARSMDAGRPVAGVRQLASAPSMDTTPPELRTRPTGVMVLDATRPGETTRPADTARSTDARRPMDAGRPVAGAPRMMDGRPVANVPPVDGYSNGDRPANSAPAQVGDRLTAGDRMTADDRMMGGNRSSGPDPANDGDRATGEARSATVPAPATAANAETTTAGAETPLEGAGAPAKQASPPRAKTAQPKGDGARPDGTLPPRSTGRAGREKAGVSG
ncbi:single-stranded DNA-binding protein [Jiangella anatolica]|uniref:Single-stranded DNA-binding protein n=1 Tax=Jiangella anatolica TaxID=2670374 RepID=A0A2W2BP23_9ACTN|nr:single-stranded DNA-binding protein [Jiangella anatolica]PZF81958.1 hypothetical protein C1I92_18675 [Jiangella anatolica]